MNTGGYEELDDHPLVGQLAVFIPGACKENGYWTKNQYHHYIYTVKKVYRYYEEIIVWCNIYSVRDGFIPVDDFEKYGKEYRYNIPADFLMPITGSNLSFVNLLGRDY